MHKFCAKKLKVYFSHAFSALLKQNLMKKLTFLWLLLGIGFTASSQVHYSLEAGGSNFLGLGFNVSYSIHPSAEKPFYMAPLVGIGKLFLYDQPMGFQFGLILGYETDEVNAIEFNSSATHFLTDAKSDKYSNNSWQYAWSNTLDFRFKPGKYVRYVIGGSFVTSITQYANGSVKFGNDKAPVLKLGIGF
ncbi:MAG TPA: hypothetical protein DCG19_14660 [Cryomorphaceae bacterium]|nr:hypothetical protein [Cryomorphaceae bacterium]HBF20730.1 hypothetical protein [Cryomorphaceae bacterium]